MKTHGLPDTSGVGLTPQKGGPKMQDEPQKMLIKSKLKIQILETGLKPEKCLKNKAVIAANPRSN